MSSRERSKTAVMLCLLMLSGLLAGCGSSAPSTGDVPPPLIPTLSQRTPAGASNGPTRTAKADPVEPEIVSWGGNGSQLAIVIRNQGDREIRSARVLITALDHDENPLFATLGPANSTCCTVFALRPGKEFGLFVNMRRNISTVGRVIVRFVSVDWAPVDAERAGSVTVKVANLRRTAHDAVVTATLEADDKVGPYLAGQAFLVDRKDRLVAVISGRFYCFAKGVTRRVDMQLLRPLPADVHIQKVIAYPIPADQPVGIENSCH